MLALEKQPPMEDIEEEELLEEIQESDDNIEKKPIVKVKKPRTQKQIDAFALSKLKRLANIKIKKDADLLIKMKEDEIHKKKMEELVVKKAISVKKKQIKREMILDEISDDDESITRIKKMVKTRISKPKIQEPEINFV